MFMKRGDSARLEWNDRIEDYVHRQKIPHGFLDKIYPCLYRGDESLFSSQLRPGVQQESEPWSGRFLLGDNLQVIDALLDNGLREKVDLIYVDPPYLSSNQYSSNIAIPCGQDQKKFIRRPVFKDAGPESIDEYLEAIYPRLLGLKELLTPQGSLFVHLDWHVSHYVKILLDEIFSRDRLINEIVWCYGGGSGSKRHFHRKHDLILWYAKGPEYIFNPQYRPYSQGTLERGLTRVKGDKYRLHQQGALMQDWWTDINKILSPTAAENLKFPTQKPEALLKRIVAAASNPDSLVADFYAGSGTTASVCEQMGRRWIMADESPISAYTTMARLIRQPSRPFSLEYVGERPVEAIGPLVLKKPVVQKYHEDSVLMLLEIEDYQPASAQMASADLKSVCLIDFWAVDLSYDGQVFSSDVQVMRKGKFGEGLELNIKVKLPRQDYYCIAVKIYDIFGHSEMAVMNF